jgi:hypothetical protein
MIVRWTGMRGILPIILALTWVASTGSAIATHGARVRSITDNASLHLISADGNTLFEQGRASGNLPGTVEVALTLGDRTATSTFTIHTTGGTIGGHGTGKLNPGRAGYDSFGGTCAVTHGTGRFRGASGECGLYGSIYRVDDSLRVQVTGKLRY